MPGVTRLRSNDPCWCGSRQKLKRCHGDHQRHRRPPVVIGRVGPPRAVPTTVAAPPYVRTGRRPDPAGVQVHDAAQLDRLRHAGRVAAEVLTAVGGEVAVGVTTDQLDEAAHQAYLARGAYPST